MTNGLRKDIVSKEFFNKNDLFRVVLDKHHQIFVDQTYTAEGRGCYLFKNLDAVKKAKAKNLISKSFRIKVDCDIYDQLERLLNEQN